MIVTSTEPKEGFVSVRSLAEAAGEWPSYDCVLTIESPDFEGGLRIAPGGRTFQAVYAFDDTDLTGGRGRAATPEEIRDMLLIARRYRDRKLLVHCLQGQIRSAAVALGVIADRLGTGAEDDAVRILVGIRPTAVCNTVVLEHADALLKRGGALKAAWERHLELDDRAAGVMLLRGLAATQA
jgi:hypothetical protein